MYKAINGWTKEKIKAHIKANFKGRAVRKTPDGGEKCMYAAPDGRKCAVGLFIPDGHRGQRCDAGAGTLLAENPDLVAHMPLSAVGMLALQDAHDYAAGDQDAMERMMTFIDENVRDEAG